MTASLTLTEPLPLRDVRPDETAQITRIREPELPSMGRHRKHSALIAALIPTCNEPVIEETIRSIREQTLVPDHIIVVVNNSDDDTAERARAAGATVVLMSRNEHQKAGALNYGFDHIRLRLPNVEYVLQMDADTVLERHFVERTYRVLCHPGNEQVGALSSAFIGKKGLAETVWQRVMMWPQAAEYQRYQDSMIRSEIHCVSGTANLMRVDALDGLRDERKGVIWDNRSLVEDYEVTLALRRSGWHCRKSKRFIAYTDLMPGVRALWKQRLRWQRGTFDELRRHGWTKYTRMDWIKQAAHGLLMLLHVAGLAYCAWSLSSAAVTGRPLAFSPWFGLCLVFIALKQAWHIREMGWRSILISLLILPEEGYNLLRHGWWLRGLYLSLRGTRQTW